jgi:hypothetical protein
MALSQSKLNNRGEIVINITREAVDRAIGALKEKTTTLVETDGHNKIVQFLLQRNANAIERATDPNAMRIICNYFSGWLDLTDASPETSLGVLLGLYMVFDAVDESARKCQDKKDSDSLIEYLVYKHDGDEKMRSALRTLERVLTCGGQP